MDSQNQHMNKPWESLDFMLLAHTTKISLLPVTRPVLSIGMLGVLNLVENESALKLFLY